MASKFKCEQLWNGKTIITNDRDQFKLSSKDFRKYFLEDPKYRCQIDSIQERKCGNGMYIFDIKYKITPKIVHLVYQDIRSGDNDMNNQKRFQIAKIDISPNEPYFYVGGYYTGDNALLVSIVTHIREINEGLSSTSSSLWLEWNNIKDIYINGIGMWNQKFRKDINYTAIGCSSAKYDFLHNVFISRSLDHYVPICVPAIPRKSFTQVVFYGAPGGGKSHRAKEETANKEVYRITFHPDTDYAAFVGSYKPVPKVIGGVEKISYEFVPQVFTMAYIDAWKRHLQSGDDAKEVCLLIEELNRGNCAQIFGDLFQLLDRTKKAFSEYSVLPSAELTQYIRGQMTDGEFELYYKEIRENSDRTDSDGYCIPEWDSTNISNNKLYICLPPNFSIVCTMNTSDQSLFPMDTAFKRRWDWKYVPINYNCEKSEFKIIVDDAHIYEWCEFLKKINEKIYDKTKSEDKQMGNFFVTGDENLEVSCEQFVSKVMFYLWNEICKDNLKIQKELYVSLIDNDQGQQLENFTFNMLFSPRRVELLVGFMKNNGIENIAEFNEMTDLSETEGETEKERMEHEIYFDEFIEYLNKHNSSPFDTFKTTFPETYKNLNNGFGIHPDFGGWIKLSRNKNANFVCYGNSYVEIMSDIFDNHGDDIKNELDIPKVKDTNKPSDSCWQFTDKHGQAKLASKHSLNKEEEYKWFVEEALAFKKAFEKYI
ncbi:MAG: AAA family ATPase [Bacteroidales bacterium]|nr:AAA family ATPase [Bacteroidales bacterium]